MANLTYNSNIFTKVNKWDKEYTYLGIQVTGKFNQHNGQDFYILDAIDIDWNGAYVDNLNTYLYSTEDLINVLDFLEHQHIELVDNITNNYLSNDKLEEIAYQLQDFIDERTAYAIINIGDTVLKELMTQYEVLASISEIVLDRSRYLRINYNDIVKNGKVDQQRQYYIFDEINQKFEVVSDIYILANPSSEYYIFLIDDIIQLNKEVSNINQIIGSEILDDNTYTYSYTGFYNRFYNIDNNISYISYYLDNAVETLEESYYYAYTGYVTSYVNSYLIGEHNQYNAYVKITDWNDPKVQNYLAYNNNKLYIYHNNRYERITYYSDPSIEYYYIDKKIEGSGILKDIDELNEKIVNNSYLLYNLSIESQNSYLIPSITPTNKNEGINRKIILDLTTSYINPITGEISNGIISHDGIINGFTYIFNWKILK